MVKSSKVYKGSNNNLIMNKQINRSEKIVEVEIWINKALLSKFRDDFDALNDVKYDYSEVNTTDGEDVRIALMYRNFGSELNFPNQDYYQLNNVFEGE